MLGEYQSLAADAAWRGGRIEAIRALASNPLCFSLPVATAVYDALAAAHRADPRRACCHKRGRTEGSA